jgi:hypothetical protein
MPEVEQTFYVDRIRKTTKGGALVVYKTDAPDPDFNGGGKRGLVSEFSIDSRKRLAFVASNANWIAW